MAFAKLAIAHGEWRLDHDHTFRLYLHPTLEIIGRNGETLHVSAFATTDGRTDSTCGKSSSTFVCAPTSVSSTTGYQGQSFSESVSRGWLEALTPKQNFHILGELSNDSSPIMAALVLRSALVWQDMEPDLVCIKDAVETNQFDGQFIEKLKYMKVGNEQQAGSSIESDSSQG
jgi:hypothetical protein